MSFKINEIGVVFNSNVPLYDLEYGVVYCSLESPDILVCRDSHDGFLVFENGKVLSFPHYISVIDSFNLEFVTHSTSEIEITIKHKEG